MCRVWAGLLHADRRSSRTICNLQEAMARGQRQKISVIKVKESSLDSKYNGKFIISMPVPAMTVGLISV